MEDNLDNLDNISELKLLESLDLGHRKIKLEDTKKEENDKFLNDINLLLSKMNEQIISIKARPKIEIKKFDIDNIDDNKDININKNPSNNNSSSNLNLKNFVNPYSKKPTLKVIKDLLIII